MGISTGRKPDQGEPEDGGDFGQEGGSDEVPKQLPAVGISGVKAQWQLPAIDIVSASA
jgi:hypothetical protein